MTHVNISKTHPAAYAAMTEFHNQARAAATAAGLAPTLVELVKIRASQLNGCAFCIRMHTAEAIELGETWQRLSVLPAWWESQYFTDAERAALHLAEQITFIAEPARVPDRGVVPVDHLTAEQISAVTWIGIVINAWNRIAICSHYPVAPER